MLIMIGKKQLVQFTDITSTAYIKNICPHPHEIMKLAMCICIIIIYTKVHRTYYTG